MTDYLFAAECVCGAQPVVRDIGPTWRVRCRSCGADTVVETSRSRAVAAWNRQVAPRPLRCRRECGAVRYGGGPGYWLLGCGCGTVTSSVSKDHVHQMYVAALGVRE